MLDIGWMELIIIGVVTLVAVGPKELPKVMRTVGQIAAKARRFAYAIEHHIDCIEHEADNQEVKETNKRSGKDNGK